MFGLLESCSIGWMPFGTSSSLVLLCPIFELGSYLPDLSHPNRVFGRIFGPKTGGVVEGVQ